MEELLHLIVDFFGIFITITTRKQQIDIVES